MYRTHYDKTNEMSVRPASASAKVAKDPSFQVDSEDSDQTGRMPRLI